MIALYLVWLAATAIPPALKFAGLFPGADSPALLPVMTARLLIATASSLTATILVGSMVTDVMDQIAQRTGMRAEGLTFGVLGVLSKWAVGGGAFIAGAIVSIVGFPVRAVPGTVDPTIINNMVLLHIPFAVALNLTGIVLLSRLPAPKPTAVPPPQAVLNEAAGLGG